MFKKRPGFTSMEIQGVTVWIPPAGHVYDRFTKKVVPVSIQQRHHKPEEQYWEPSSKEEYQVYLQKRKDEISRQARNPTYIDEWCEEYRKQQWFNRVNGVWFMNNGEPVYLTGLHWMYLSWWPLDIGLPEFRYSDLQYFYHLQLCLEDPKCGGQISFFQRRQGKSYRLGIFVAEAITRMNRALGGIQSKSAEDAKELYMLHILEPLLSWPDFFMPEYDKAGGKSPKSGLRFFATNRRGDSTDERDMALSSWIKHKDASEKAFDGKKTNRYIADEFGKLPPQYSLLERHRIMKPCIMTNGKIVGKMCLSTTVEDMGGDKSSGVKNIEECKQLALDSDPTKKDANGFTPSLLYKFFLPADETTFFDKYGMPQKEKARQYYENKFQYFLENNDFVGWASEKRKFPLEFEDVFRVAANAPIFRVDLIYDRLASLAWKSEAELATRGNLVWAGGKRDGVVKFVPSPTGRFLFRVDLNGKPQNIHRPMNKGKGVIGVDPYEHKASQRPSDGAAYGLKKYDPFDLENSNSLIFEYCARPAPHIFFEDMVRAAVYTGYKVMCENNRIGMIQYFQERGYGDFLIWLPGQVNPGIFAGDRSKQLLAEAIDAYIQEYVNKIFFPLLLEDLAKFDISNSTAFDRSMAFGWTLVGAGDLMSAEPEEKIIEVTDLFRRYGTLS